MSGKYGHSFSSPEIYLCCLGRSFAIILKFSVFICKVTFLVTRDALNFKKENAVFLNLIFGTLIC